MLVVAFTLTAIVTLLELVVRADEPEAAAKRIQPRCGGLQVLFLHDIGESAARSASGRFSLRQT